MRGGGRRLAIGEERGGSDFEESPVLMRSSPWDGHPCLKGSLQAINAGRGCQARCLAYWDFERFFPPHAKFLSWTIRRSGMWEPPSPRLWRAGRLRPAKPKLSPSLTRTERSGTRTRHPISWSEGGLWSCIPGPTSRLAGGRSMRTSTRCPKNPETAHRKVSA